MEYKNTDFKRKDSNLEVLGIFKVICLSLTTTVPNSILNEIQKIQKPLSWYFSKPKIIRHSAMRLKKTVWRMLM